MTRIIAVMITGKAPERRRLAARSVRAFLDSHPIDGVPFNLLIINDNPEGVEWFSHWPLGELKPSYTITEVLLPHDPQRTLGDLRNEAFNHVLPTDVMIQWDDDDYSHPDRIGVQYAEFIKSGGKANILRREAILDLEEGRQSFVFDAHRWPRGGFPGTIMHAANITQRYPSIPRDQKQEEDSVFLRRIPGVTTIDNQPSLYVRVIHGGNTWPRDHIMSRVGGSIDSQFVEGVADDYFDDHLDPPKIPDPPEPEEVSP